VAGRKTFVRADAFEVSRATAAATCSSVAVVGRLSFASACSRVICALHIDEMNTQAREHIHAIHVDQKVYYQAPVEEQTSTLV